MLPAARSPSQNTSALASRTWGSAAISARVAGLSFSSTPTSAMASPPFSARPSAKVAMLMPRSPSFWFDWIPHYFRDSEERTRMLVAATLGKVRR